MIGSEKVNKPKISVIVPVYNTEKYLKRCIDSIINQTYENLEIILVDDGSTDGSERIVDSYSQRDSRVIVVHQLNRGESNARNVGLRIATGDYIAFCDCDDWIEPQMYQTMIEVAQTDCLDIVVSSWYRDTQCQVQEIINDQVVESGIFGREQLLKYIYMRDSYRGFAYMWNKMYHRKCIYDSNGNRILFDETIQLGGDVLFLAEVALNAKRVKYLDKAFYHYIQRADSGCHTQDVKKLRDWIRTYEKVIILFEKEGISQNTIDYVKRFLAYHASNATQIAILQRDGQAEKEFKDIMRKYQREYINLNQDYRERIVRYLDLLK